MCVSETKKCMPAIYSESDNNWSHREIHQLRLECKTKPARIYNSRLIWNELTEEERERIEKVIVVGSPISMRAFSIPPRRLYDFATRYLDPTAV